MKCRISICLRTQRAHRANRQLKGPLDLGAICFRRVELGGEKDRAERFPNVAITLLEACATRSTSAAGGLSPTKCRANFVAMNRAVDGWCAGISSTISPSPVRPRRNFVAQHNLFAVVMNT
jgi:hypothetical protein